MRIESSYLAATLLAVSAFVMTGGVQAAEQAIQAEEQAAAKAPPAETAIPFADMGGIRDWHADDDETLYVQDIHRSWYLAKLMAPCVDLTFATAIGFETKGTNRLDRFATVIVRGQRCPLASFVASGPPPSRAKPGKGNGVKSEN